MTNTILIAPAANMTYAGRHGTNYTSAADRSISVLPTDVQDMIAAGCVAPLKNPQPARWGQFTCNGATAVTVANPTIAANDSVVVTLLTVGGTVGALPHITTITAGTGFTVVGTASDTSVYNYSITSNAS